MVEIIREAFIKLQREHEEIGDAVHTIRHLSHEYSLPLENNIFYPKAALL